MQGINLCYEKSKSCLEGCDECYDKQLYGWYGAIQRQLQRSQYHMQYSRPMQVVFSAVILLCVIGEPADYGAFCLFEMDGEAFFL